MKFSVQAWAPEYGPTAGQELGEGDTVDVNPELRESDWRPLAVGTDPAPEALFVDGVRRVDANLWIESPEGAIVLALAASYAAGAVLSNHRATVIAEEVRRGIFTSAPNAESVTTRYGDYQVHLTEGDLPEKLWLGLQGQMSVLEGMVAAAHIDVPLIVVDGPLSHRRHVPGAVGYIKTQHVHYLPEPLRPILGRLQAGERTPIFLIGGGAWNRLSWYAKLPLKSSTSVDGLIRAEVAAADLDSARRVADLMTATILRFASEAHKDPRAPQNLYPIGGLERRLRHRLGDRELMIRGLRRLATR
ncbi:hypothetical protein BH18ACT6_BH18ACT6_01330 [soil metagenome]